MNNYEVVYAELEADWNGIVAARRGGLLTGQALIDAVSEWDARCRDVHEARQRQTARLLVRVYQLYPEVSYG